MIRRADFDVSTYCLTIRVVFRCFQPLVLKKIKINKGQKLFIWDDFCFFDRLNVCLVLRLQLKFICNHKY